MIQPNLPTGLFQTFYVSKEASNCPLLIDMIRIGRTLETLGIPEDGYGTISMKYGKRLLINAKHADIRQLTQQDILEIVDYDPIKRVMLVIGTREPPLETPVHWIIQKARHDITILLEITSPSILHKFPENLPSTEQNTPLGTLERVRKY